MVGIIIIFIAAIIFYSLPFWLKIILTIINSLIPDTIPIIDELVMAGGSFAHFFRLIKASQFATKHPALLKALFIIIGVPLLLIIGSMIYSLFKQ
ncbi:MAG: hypothetical protein IJ368_05230 [Oscillospiraceae bacterium]|nr:hypothetical protein [Oscillospiraceae bacterium]